ncbi:MAG: Ig-like domain-containing protein [Eubacteriales bacterium]
MVNLVELLYNPYIPKLSILIDGNPPSEFSRLIQYCDEEVWEWGSKILDTIYLEVRNDFVVSFTGTKEDSEILSVVSKKHPNCKDFKYKDFLVTKPLQKRMQELNQFIKKHDSIKPPKTNITVFFLLSSKAEKHSDEVGAICVSNLYCTVNCVVLGEIGQFQDTNGNQLVIVTDETEDINTYLEKAKSSHFAYIIQLSDSIGISDVLEGFIILRTKSEQLLNTIFSCLLQRSLLIAFRNCFQGIQRKTTTKELTQIGSIEPIVSFEVEPKIIAGKSNPLVISLDPPVGPPPKLVYKTTDPRIATCDGLAVFGIQDGKTQLEVYHMGDISPFYVKDIIVHTRRPIKKMILSDDNLVLGEGVKMSIKCEIIPENADNANSITWKSTDETVLVVSRTGELTAKKSGQCKVFCVADNVSVQCLCEVKPFLEKIDLNINLTNGALTLEQLSEQNLVITKFPSDSIDGEINVNSSDLNVVNVIKTTLYAKETGEAVITIKNNSSRITEKFRVKVIPKKKFSFAKSIFKK